MDGASLESSELRAQRRGVSFTCVSEPGGVY